MAPRRKDSREQQTPRVTGPTGPHDRDAEVLAHLAQEDHHAALRALMRGYGEPIYGYCRNVLQSPALADDVHQNVFIDAFEHLPNFKGTALRPWLYRIAHNRCLDALKLRRRWWHRFFLTDDLPDAPDPSPSSEERLIAGSDAAKLEKCLKELKPQVRLAIILRYQEGFTYEEMADICHESAAALKMRVTRALPKLRASLHKKGVVR